MFAKTRKKRIKVMMLKIIPTIDLTLLERALLIIKPMTPSTSPAPESTPLPQKSGSNKSLRSRILAVAMMKTATIEMKEMMPRIKAKVAALLDPPAVAGDAP